MLIGRGILLTFASKIPKGRLLLFGMSLEGFTFVPYFFVNSLAEMAIVTIFHAIAIPFLTVSTTSIIPEIVPENMTGRIFSLISLAVVGLTAVSSGISGIILEFISVKLLFMIIGFAGGFVGILGYLFAHDLRKHK